MDCYSDVEQLIEIGKWTNLKSEWKLNDDKKIESESKVEQWMTFPECKKVEQ